MKIQAPKKVAKLGDRSQRNALIFVKYLIQKWTVERHVNKLIDTNQACISLQHEVHANLFQFKVASPKL
jgi:hypothetical protein